MEKFDRNEMIFYTFQGVIIVAAIYLISWLPIQLLLDENQNKKIVKVGQTPQVVDKYIQQSFNKLRIPLPNNQAFTIETINPKETSQGLHQDLINSGVEAYVSHGEQQSEMRIYDVKQLRYRIQFVLESDVPVTTNIDREQVKLAIVFSNIGDSDIQNIIKITEPISVAIKPYTPFALRVANKAALNWHEVLIDLREIETPEWDVLPFYSGILTHQLLAPPSNHIIQLFPSTYVPSDQNKSLRSGIMGIGSSARSTLQRGLKKSLNSGQAIIIIDVEDPELHVVLNWIEHRDNDLIKLVFLSEIPYLSL